MKRLIQPIVIAFLVGGASIVFANDNALKDYGVEKQTRDVGDERIETYKKEISNDKGVYFETRREFKNDGPRESAANEKPNSGSKGFGVYVEF